MKEKNRLSMYGVGPLYVGVIAAITVLFIVLHCTGSLPSGKVGNSAVKIVFYVFGGLLIAYGVVLWVIAVLVNRIDKDIADNRLRTTGIYGAVRNPIYAAFLFLCTGALLCCANWWFLIAPVVYYLYLTALMIFTEEKWLRETFGAEYEAYCKKVNRCIPWFPKKG